MNLNDLANIGQVIGAVAVVVLVVLCRAPNSAKHQRRSVCYCSDDARTLRQLVPRSRLRSRALSNRRQGIAGLHIAVRAGESQVHGGFMSFLSYSQNAFLKWRQKLLAPDLWLGWEFVIMNLVCAPGGKAFWKDRGYMFGEEFRRYVENDLMKREPHPDAKPRGAFPIGRRAE
jgi:hypothetical protein